MAKSIKKVRGPIAVTVAVLVVLVTACVLFFILCRVDSITVEGCELYSTDEIIEVAGIEKGIFILSVDGDGAVRSILQKFSVIKKADVSVSLPDKVVITVVEEPPTFCTAIGVSTVMFSHELRVAEVRMNSTDVDGIPVILPEISEAIGGKRIVFSDGEPSYITRMLQAVSVCELLTRITLIDCTSARNASVTVDGKYTLITGGISDIDVKLDIALEYLKNERITASKSAVLDLTDPKEVIVTVEE